MKKLNQESLKIIDNINVSDRSMFDCMNFCKKCMAYISQLEKPEMETLLNQSGIDEINAFISALQKYTDNYFARGKENIALRTACARRISQARFFFIARKIKK